MYLAAPDSNVTGTNTMQMVIVETNAGAATCSALVKIAEASGLPERFRCVFSSSTVASSTSMPTASARPPKDMMLMVWCSMDRTAIANKTASGIEVQTINVLRQLPRKIRIIKAVNTVAVTASCTTSFMEARTITD
jgi:hypothetical protein